MGDKTKADCLGQFTNVKFFGAEPLLSPSAVIAVKGCERDAGRGYHQLIRDTWAKPPCVYPVRFFVGNGQMSLREDEVRLHCDDSYEALPYKTKAILQWFLAHAYDFIFLCDTDTYIAMPALCASGFEKYDYVGKFGGDPGVPKAQDLDTPQGTVQTWAWASGGCGYWLSRRAAEFVVEREPDHWAEDCWVGQVLGPAIQEGRFTAQWNHDYGWHTDGDRFKTVVSSHYCTRGKRRDFDPTWMRQHHHRNAQP